LFNCPEKWLKIVFGLTGDSPRLASVSNWLLIAKGRLNQSIVNFDLGALFVEYDLN
jgi:hypothetical protein